LFDVVLRNRPNLPGTVR